MNHSSQPTRNRHSQRAQRIVGGAPFSSMRLRQPGHTAYLSPHCAGRLFASRGRTTIVQYWGGAETIFRDVRGTGICSRLTSSLASADVKSDPVPRTTAHSTIHVDLQPSPLRVGRRRPLLESHPDMVKDSGSNDRVAPSPHGYLCSPVSGGRVGNVSQEPLEYRVSRVAGGEPGHLVAGVPLERG